MSALDELSAQTVGVEGRACHGVVPTPAALGQRVAVVGALVVHLRQNALGFLQLALEVEDLLFAPGGHQVTGRPHLAQVLVARPQLAHLVLLEVQGSLHARHLTLRLPKMALFLLQQNRLEFWFSFVIFRCFNCFFSFSENGASSTAGLTRIRIIQKINFPIMRFLRFLDKINMFSICV